jgi:uncharacterized membrane protein YphA (DoxX/SURF4 family)
MKFPRVIAHIKPDHVLAILRVALGLVLIIGGIKLAFPVDAMALAQSYVNPATGWISPFYQQLITEHLNLEIIEFLRIQGMVEIMIGATLILGMFTSLVSGIMGVMFIGFVVANPDIGEIRLIRDVSLAGLSFALALAGGGIFSMDGLMFRKKSHFQDYKDVILFLIRASLGITLIVSVVFAPELFPGHAFSNAFNSVVPGPLVLILGAMLVVGLYPRAAVALLAVWLLYLIGAALLDKPFYLALDAVKREIGFLGATVVFAVLGPDRWSWPKIGK